MVLSNPNNGDCDISADDPHRLSEDLDSGCSTPYVSAPSSPGRTPSGYFFSAPASPIHHFLISSSSKNENVCSAAEAAAFLTLESSGSFEFEFSSRFSPTGSHTNGLMSSADELFLNGQIRPMKLSSHLQRPQILAPFIDLDGEDDDEDVGWCINGSDQFTRGRDLRARNKSVHRKARSMSPLRTLQFERRGKSNVNVDCEDEEEEDNKETETETETETGMPSIETTPSCSASSSRSSSSGRNSMKWLFLKDLLLRSKSEGRANNKERFWSTISFSPGKEKKLSSPVLTPSSSRDEKTEKAKPEKSKRKGSKLGSREKKSAVRKPANGVSRRRATPSAHELHYTTNRAQAEEMKKKTFLPYRQGLLGCLSFSSKGYGALNGLTKSLNPISSR